MAVRAAINLINGEIIPIATGAVATISGDINRFQIDEATIVNTSTSEKFIDIYILQSGDTVINANRAVSQRSLAGNETFLLLELVGMSINAGGSIQASVSSGTDVSMFVTGTEFTTA